MYLHILEEDADNSPEYADFTQPPFWNRKRGLRGSVGINPEVKVNNNDLDYQPRAATEI